MRWAVAALLCGTAVLADGQAADLARHKARLAAAATTLEANGDPDALAAAALFRWRSDNEAALALLERASRAQLSPPGLTWLRATLCGAALACDPASLEARFRVQDPDNGLGWFADIHRAYAAGDAAGLEAALARAASLPAVDLHFTSMIGRLADAVDRAGALPPGEAVSTVAGELAAAPVLVQLAAAARACGTEGLQRPSRADACRALARSMMAGDTVLTEMLGVAIAKRAWPSDSTEWREASEARRIQRYRLARVGEFEPSLETDAIAARAVIALHKALPREQDVLVARLEARGIDPMPPPGWREPTPK